MTLAVPPLIDTVLRERNALLAVSISGGKDSQTMLDQLVWEHAGRGWRAQILPVHAHLGRAEWPMTLAHVRNHCARLGMEPVVVHRAQGDMLQRWEQHYTKMQGMPRSDQLSLDGNVRPMNHWSRDGNARYCTAELKRGPINQVFTGGKGPRAEGWDLVVCAEGLRKGEGTKRRKRLSASGPLVVRPMVTGSRILQGNPTAEQAYAHWQQLSQTRDVRLALDWYPLIDWSEDEVFRAGGSSLQDVERRRALWRAREQAAALEAFHFHPAYAMGNWRLSCALCVLACDNDWRNGILHHPALAGSIIRMERGSGWAFGNSGRSVEQTARAIGIDPDGLLAQAYAFGEVA